MHAIRWFPARSRALLVLPLLLAASAAAWAVPPGCTSSVGSGDDCVHPTLAAALLAAAFSGSPSTVCLTNSQANVDFDLVNFDQAGVGLTLRGGYASCSASSATGYTLLSGDGVDPAFDISAGAGEASIVRFERVAILSAAPAIRAGSGAEVTVVNSILEDSIRGIEARAGARVTLDALTQVAGNSHPTTGAGILCEDAQVDLAALVSENIVSSSSANNRGGGIWAEGCVLNLLEGAWIEGNRAPTGAGMYLFDTFVRGGGTGPLGVRVSDNQTNAPPGAGGSGAAITAGGTTDLLLGNARVDGNVGQDSIINVLAGARVQIERFNFETCAAPPRCATLSGNDAPTIVRVSGSANLGTFRMMQGFVEDNLGPVGETALFAGPSEGARIELDGLQVHGNRVQAIFDMRGGGQVTGGFLSVARNGPDLASPDVDLVLGGSPSRADLYSSILQDHGGFTDTITTLDCVIAESLASVTATRSIVSSDPGFVDAAGGDLHLRADSIAIDYCDTSAYTPLDSDFDLDARGLNHPRADGFGRFDLGADERKPDPPPAGEDIFKDGFES